MGGIVAGGLADSTNSGSTARAGLHPDQRPAGLSELSGREAEVTGLVADGLANKEIAGLLGITEGTVKAHLGAAFSKLGVRNRTQAAVIVHEWRHSLQWTGSGS
jgi:DNA-binding NarL/FixJ family response regulator